ncbi:hypothetical protein [Paenibacillus periandrae]|uniref:hypothetical protein n=1 Tax=Paenibacillus periandrae TaxID=1761741 RepID=UPI001F090E91|nr:hypothetical protein [Paenibacillus periandrae]
MITAWPLAAVLLLIHLILPLLKREGERLAPDPSIMSAQLSVMGNLSAKETAALIVMLGGGLAMTLAYWLGLSLLGVSLLMVLALSACGLLTKAVARGVSYEPFIVFALLASAAGLYEEVGLQRLTAGWISQHMSAAGALVALFALVSLLARFVPPMLAIFAGLTALGCGSVEAGASGAQAAVAAVLAAQWPISLPVAKKLWSPAVLYRVLSASLALLVAVYVWHWTGAGDERQPPVSKSVMATAGGPAALEVPIAVQLPHDALAAASVKQGVELAVADAQLSAVSPPMQLWPDYRGSGEAGRSGGAAPVFAIAAAESDSASAVRRELPTLLLDGSVSAGGLSVALAPAPEAYAGKVADLLLDQSLNKVAVYYEDSVPGRQFAAALEQEAERRGIRVVDRLAAISGRSALTDAIVRWKLLQAQAVTVYDGSGGVAPELSTGLTQAGALYPLFVGPSLPGADVLAAYKGEVYGYTDLDAKTGRTEAEAFAERYRSAYGAEPSRLAAAAYDAVRLIAQSAGLAAAAEPARMREAMARIGSWEGAVRRYTFTPLQGGGGDNGASVHIVSLTPEPTPKTPKSGTTGETKR